MPREWVISDYSGFEGLSLNDCAEETAGPGEVKLKIEAFALNWGDMDLMQGRYSFRFASFPARIGMEAVGIVDQIGPDVEGISVGERYCTLPHFYGNRGASAESIVVASKYLTKAPEGLSAVESTSIWMQYMTAYYPIVELAKADPEKSILVTAATGTAGYAALEIGRMFGANMIGTTRFEYNREYLEQGGANHVYVQGSGDIVDAINAYTGSRGVDAAFDPIGASMIHQYAGALAKNAIIFHYGTLDENLPTLPMMEMYQANATFHPYSLFHYVEDPKMCAKGTSFVYEALSSGDLKPSIDRVYPMEGYRDAWEYMSKPRKSHGKIVVETGI